MTITEMIYVLDKLKECIQTRSDEKCPTNCKNCPCYMESSSLLDALERIINIISNMNKHSTRKDF